MIKVVMWDYTGESSQWTKNFLRDGVEIVRTLLPDDLDQADVIMRGDWDFVLIFEQGQRKLFDEIFEVMKSMNISTKNIIFAKDFFHLLNHPDAVRALFKPSTDIYTAVQRQSDFFNHKRWDNKYVSCSVEGLHYVASTEDLAIAGNMYVTNSSFASNDIKSFHELSKKYYGIDSSGGGGIFLVLGANIGTTGIYFLKKFAPDMRVIAFEPDAENFKLLRINTILNSVEDNMTLVNYGLGDKFSEMTMYIEPSNPGYNSVIKFEDRTRTETIKIIPLDAYLAENKIAVSDVKYIWIDTEGFEPQVLLGAKKLLREKPFPIFMECNLKAWDKSGCFEDMLTLLAEQYSHFILLNRNGTETLCPLEALRTLERPNNPFGQIGDIFLIRKGTIA